MYLFIHASFKLIRVNGQFAQSSAVWPWLSAQPATTIRKMIPNLLMKTYIITNEWEYQALGPISMTTMYKIFVSLHNMDFVW